jgi:asparagine synthase (glutamine-hydrolysing)
MPAELSKAIEQAVVECLEDKISIAFSGGVDSATMATAAKKFSGVELFCAGTPDCEDFVYARKVAGELGLPLHEVMLDAAKILEIYGKIHSFYPAGLLKIEIGIPIYACCEAAGKAGFRAMLFGSGAEELFVGYERYYICKKEGADLDAMLRAEFAALPAGDVGMVRKIAYKCGIEARFPFCNRALAEAAFAIPVEERMADPELKKCALREAGRMLGVPQTALMRRKKAAQYGSGVHKVLIRNSDEINGKYPNGNGHGAPKK